MVPTIIQVMIKDIMVGIPVCLWRRYPKDDLYRIGKEIARVMCPHAEYMYTEQPEDA